ncbi:DUF397 domain-containing protein [Actinomadura sp. 1N219]|uniref:DUF397 domain-containing protein n=1 Tax=Actinomadura sp. 1N219 TaxID=3375152 RepID=UPI003797B9BA
MAHVQQVLLWLGHDRPRDLPSAVNLVLDLRVLGDCEEALDLRRDDAQHATAKFGREHKKILLAAVNLVLDLCVLGDCEEALDLRRDDAQHATAKFGREHKKILLAAVNLVLDLRALGDCEEALDLHRDDAQQPTKKFGPCRVEGHNEALTWDNALSWPGCCPFGYQSLALRHSPGTATQPRSLNVVWAFLLQKAFDSVVCIWPQSGTKERTRADTVGEPPARAPWPISTRKEGRSRRLPSSRGAPGFTDQRSTRRPALMRSLEGSGAAWRKSSRCDDSADCVEVARLASGGAGVRDTTEPGNHLELSDYQWRRLEQRIKKGEYDSLP